MSGKIAVDSTKCNGCMLCMQICVLGNFEPGEDGKVRAADGLDCYSCGHCVAICPTQAMSHADLTSGEPLNEDARPSYEQFLEFLKMRRSRREFKDEPVTKDVIDKLLAAAVEAPSSLNIQSIEYTAITDRQVLKQLSEKSAQFFIGMAKMMGSPIGKLIFKATVPRHVNEGLTQLMPIVNGVIEGYKSGRDLVLYDAPCVILLHAPKTDMYAPSDAIFNAENILLAAETLGLGACVIGMVTEPANRDPKIRRLAHIPDDHKVFSTIILGYPKFKYKRSAPKNPPKMNYV